MDGDGLFAEGVASECECAICKGESDCAVCYAETVKHFGSDNHFEGTNSCIDANEFHSHPLAEWIIIIHFMKDIFRIHKRGVFNRIGGFLSSFFLGGDCSGTYPRGIRHTGCPFY